MSRTTPEPGAPAVELVVIKLRPDARPADRERIERCLSAWGAEAVLVAHWGWIVQLAEAAKALVRADRAVALVGGIQPGARNIPRIRVPIDRVP